MKVTIVFGKVRTVFDFVETLSFGDFAAAVAATFGLDSSSFDILLGDNVVVLDVASPITDFGIISGDLLYVRLKSAHFSNAASNSSVSEQRDGVIPDPTTGASQAAAEVEILEQPSSLDERTCTDELADDEELDTFLIAFITDAMTTAGFETALTAAVTTSDYASRVFTHPSVPELAAEVTLNFYRDAQLPATGVTSAALTSMTVVQRSATRNFYDTIYVHRNTAGLTELMSGFETQLRESMLGPSNQFLRALSQDYVAEIFRHLSPADVLSVERTCRYARNRCLSSRLIDEAAWRPALHRQFGESEFGKVSAAARQPSTSAGPSSADTPCTYREAYMRKRKEQKAYHLFHEQRRCSQLPDWPAGVPPLPSSATTPSYLPVGPRAPGPGQPDVGNPPDAPLMRPNWSTNPDINPLAPGYGHMFVPNQPHCPRHPNIDPFHPFAPDGFNPPDPDMPQGPSLDDGRFPGLGGRRPFSGGGGSGNFFPGGGFIG